MKSIVEIQILSPLTKQQLIQLRDEIRSIDGMAAFDLKLPSPSPVRGTMAGGSIEEVIIYGLLAGIIHFVGEKATEYYHNQIKKLLKKYQPATTDVDMKKKEAMGGKGLEAVISEQTDTYRKVTFIDGGGNEQTVNNRDFSINPERTYAILIGISEYDDKMSFSIIPPVAGNVSEMYRVLNDKRLVGLPISNIYTLYNETSIGIIKKLSEVSRLPNIETLIIYFSGHGQNNGKNQLSLIARDTHNIDERLHNAIAYEDIERLIKTSPAPQKIVILDACHSGLAAQGTNANSYDFEPVLGTYTLASTSADEASYYKKEASHTYFTGFILKLFNHGIRNVNTMLSLHDIYKYTSEQLQKIKFPMPVRKYDMKNVDENKFFISNNPGFDLKALQKRPVEMLVQGKLNEAEIEYYRLLREFPDDTAWLKEYEDTKKNLLFGNIVSEADNLFRLGKYVGARTEYLRAMDLSNTPYVAKRIVECNQMITRPTDGKVNLTRTDKSMDYTSSIAFGQQSDTIDSGANVPSVNGGKKIVRWLFSNEGRIRLTGSILIGLVLVTLVWWIISLTTRKSIKAKLDENNELNIPFVSEQKEQKRDSTILVLTSNALGFESKGDVNKAIELYEQVQRMDPKNEIIDSALSRLKSRLLSLYSDSLAESSMCSSQWRLYARKIIDIDSLRSTSKSLAKELTNCK